MLQSTLNNLDFEYDYSSCPISQINNNSHPKFYFYCYLSKYSIKKIDSIPQIQIHHPHKKKSIYKQKRRYFPYWNHTQSDEGKKLVSLEDLDIKLKLIKERIRKIKPLIDLNADFIPFEKSKKERKKIDLKCSYCNSNHILSKCKEYIRTKVNCNYCNGIGHTINECLKFPFSNNNNIDNSNNNTECLQCGNEGHLYCISSEIKKIGLIMSIKDINHNKNDISNNSEIALYDEDDNRMIIISDDEEKYDEMRINAFNNDYIKYQPQPSILLKNKLFYDEDDDISI